MTRIMAAHQPNFLPYLGFFDKMRAVDQLGTEPGIFIIRDDCQFVDSDYHHRNRIRTNEGWKWLNIPIEKKAAPLGEIKIKTEGRISNVKWNIYHLRQIEANYKKTPFFEKYFPGLKEIYMEPGDNLSNFNMRLIKYLAECFGIKTKIILFSELPEKIEGEDATDVLVNAAKAVKADTYLSGDGGKKYLDVSRFTDVELKFQDYKHPIHPQRFSGFEPFMSAIDALFNLGRLPRQGEVVK